jgi:hypothetical protein
MVVDKESALSASGQLWKPFAAAALMASGLLISDAGRRSTSTGSAFLTIIGGILAALIAGVWLLTSVRCPKCGARWYWIALTEDSALRVLTARLTLSACQRCGYPHERATNTRP